MAPRNTLAAAIPFGNIQDTTSPGAIPSAESSAARPCAASRKSPYDTVDPDSGASRNSACGCALAWWSMASRIVRGVIVRSGTEFLPVRAEDLVVGRLPNVRGSEWHHDARDVEKVPVVEVVGKTVAAPRPAPHRHRERQRIVEAAAGREAMNLVDDDAAYGQRQSQFHRATGIARMQADGEARPLIREGA